MSVVSHDPRTGLPAESAEQTTTAEVLNIVQRAAGTAPVLAATSPHDLREWLRAIADGLEAHQDELARLADTETALGLDRLTGEVNRAANQLRFYGDVAVEGSHLGVTIDPRTDTTPELVRVNRPVGPVAVFGASNFPFAFSVLGNDTGAALAAGCPVVVKAHPAHVGLSLRQAEIAREALEAVGAPAGTFDVVVGHQAGVDLVQAPPIAAVAFTGSQAGGLALWRLANERETVIPVFAEMGTVNPVIVTRDGSRDITAVAAGFVGSFTLGNGQFCTKPGIMLAPRGASALEPGSRLLEECFGAVALVCEYDSDDDLGQALSALQPSLAASLITGDENDRQAPRLLELLADKVGRVAVNEWPTGVAFTWAQQHGGPWPSTSVASATSVGAAGLARFVRPVAFQSAHDAWLPTPAQATNPWRVPRRIGGRLVLGTDS